jgi:hypothetical protein
MATDAWCELREHQALLRSVGHLYRDGRWTGSDDDTFHVYKEVEHPALGEMLTFLAHPNYFRYDSAKAFTTEMVPMQWRPAISRSVISENFDSSLHRHLPPITDPDTGDFTLNLNAQGTAFIVKNRPGNPVAHLGQYLVELRELPAVPIFLERRAKHFRDLGSEYLNIEFGWVPFVQDLRKIHNLTLTLHQRLALLIKNNGINVRRRSKKVVTTDSSLIWEGSLDVPFGDLFDTSIGGSPYLDGYTLCGPFGGLVSYPSTWGGQADYRLSHTKYGTEWNCGTFRYYVPDIGTSQWTDRAVRALYGSNVTPALIYSVYPWTWLVDWFANIGDIFSNMAANAVDNETLTNCYSMYTETVYDVVEVSSHWDAVSSPDSPGAAFDLSAGSVSLVHTLSTVNKLRRQASPFGFGLKREDFSSRQLAILAALLTSRSDNKRIRRLQREVTG